MLTRGGCEASYSWIPSSWVEGASDVVEPVQQALALKRIEFERDLAARRIDDQLPLEIDLDDRAAADRVDQRAELGGREDDRDEPILRQFVAKISPNDGAITTSKP